MSELKPCPMCGGSPNKPAKNGGSDERSGYNFTVTVACKCGLRIDRASHQNKQGWCNDSGQAEAEAIAAWNRRAQPEPAAPSVAPEPVAWTLQSELDAAQTTCSAHLWFTNPRNSAWTALFTREQIAAHPPRAPLTEEEFRAAMEAAIPGWEPDENLAMWAGLIKDALEAAHCISAEGATK